MRRADEVLGAEAGRRSNARDDLAAIYADVQQLSEDLLDFNPMLALMAEGLAKAVALELASQSLGLKPSDHSAA